MIKKTLFSLVCLMLSLTVWAQKKSYDIVAAMNGMGKDYIFQDSRNGGQLSSCRLITTEDGKKALEVENTKASSDYYNCELKFRSTSDVKKGDVLQAVVTVRTVYARQETGESSIQFYFQRAVSPWEKSIVTQVNDGAEWKTFTFPFTASTDLRAGEAVAVLAFATLAQKVQVGGVEIRNYHHSLEAKDLPKTRLTYAGREEGAAWRTEALKRIDQLRTAPLTVHVVNAKGKEIKGADVKIKMHRSAFIWGTAVNEETLASDDADAKTYKQKLLQFFNTAVMENGFKTYGWSWDDKHKQQTLKAFDWLYKNGMRQRGHNLVWPGWKFNPRYMRLIAERDTAVFRKFIQAQFYERMAYTKGKVIAWDVVNEMMHEKDFFKYLPKDVAVEWFKEAKKLDPDAQLFINDYGMLNGTQSPLVISQYINIIKDLRSKGAPVEAAGVQGHVGAQPRSPIQVLSDLDMFYKENIPVQITEFDINTDDEDLQADYTRDFLIAAYSHPAVHGVNLWGFWQKRHWKPNAALFRSDWTLKANGRAWQQLVCGEWTTKWEKKSDRNGDVTGKAHLGEYDITVSYNGITVNTTANLLKEGTTVLVQMTHQLTLANGYNKVDSVKPLNVNQAGTDLLTVGCETFDRDYTDYDAYKTYLPKLGIKNLRMQAGWAKIEKQKGVYDFAWLDHIVDDAIARGHRVWLQLSYGNPIYEGGGNANLGGGMPVSAEAKNAWNNWVRAIAEHFRGRVSDWEIWNEPDLSGKIDADAIVDMNVRTASILKSVDPQCRIAGLAFCVLNKELLTECLDKIKATGKMGLFHWISYHGYTYRPEDAYKDVEAFKTIISEKAPGLKLRQGENGAPSQGHKGGALTDYDWTELSQAKWDLRRLSGDHAHGVESSVFSIIDMVYPNGENKYVSTINVKGLLQSSPLKEAVRPKEAYRAVQNYASLFHHFKNLQPAGTSVIGKKGEGMCVNTYSDAKGNISVLYWDGSKIPQNTNSMSYTTLTINVAMQQPVCVDVLTGNVYEIPSSLVTTSSNKTIIGKVPVYDSPIMIVDKGVL